MTLPWGTYHNLRLLAQTGFWYCPRCEHIVEPLRPDGTIAPCPRCKKPTARWQSPCFAANEQTSQ
jgi:rubrerythrin